MTTYSWKRVRTGRVVSATVLMLGLGASAFACSSAELDIKIVDACISQSGQVGFRDRATYAEFVVFKSSCPQNSCADVEAKLIAGDTSDALFRRAVPAGEPLPSIGDLDMGKYAMAVVLKDDSCVPVAYGCACTELEGSGKKSVQIPVAAWRNGSSAEAACQPLKDVEGCQAPASCSAGLCEVGGDAGPIPDGGPKPDGGGGGDCSLSVVASGDLPAPLVADVHLSGPAITATDEGFVVGYREQSPATTEIQFVLQPISDAGVPSVHNKVVSQATCQATPKDGIGLAFHAGSGILTAGFSECTVGGGAGASFLPFNAQGVPGAVNNLGNPGFLEVTLAPQKSVVPNFPEANEYEFAFRVRETGRVQSYKAILAGAGFKDGADLEALFGAATVDFVQIARTESVRGLLGRIPDRGVVSLVIGAPGGITEELELADASWSSITAWNDRVAAILPASSGLRYHVVSADGTEAGTGTLGSGAARGGDVVALDGRVIALSSGVNRLALHRLDAVDSVPVVGESTTFTGTVGEVNLSSFEGDLVAMAAARGQVALAWLNRGQLSDGDTVGGWAILECGE